MKLESITTIHARIGWQNLRTSEFLDSGEYMLITGTDFKNGEIDYSNIHYVEQERYEQDKKIQIEDGSILITKDGTLGKVAYVKELPAPATLNAGVFNVKVNKNVEVNQKYLFHYLYAPFLLKFASEQSTGGTIKHLNQNVLVKFQVPLTSFEEQSKISDFLTKFDQAITLQQRKLELLKKLKQGYLQQMFPTKDKVIPQLRFSIFNGDWEQVKLGNLGHVAMNKRIFKDETSSVGEIPFYKIGTFGKHADAFISRELFEEYRAKYPYPKVGDLLISASGSIGKVVEYTGEDEYFQDSNIVWLAHDTKITNAFLKQIYQTIKWAGLEGSTIKRLYNKNILDTQICMPSLSEQNLISKLLTFLDDAYVLQQSKFKQQQQLKQAYLQKLFP
ncbi:restriction endonuclease subunit S [Latilactobacillus sakei]|uniref:restriction endonuclease subunit S n=1 Tax=Latilactobacillus sakei TaxID=1599 RepID=UPI0038877F0A